MFTLREWLIGYWVATFELAKTPKAFFYSLLVVAREAPGTNF